MNGFDLPWGLAFTAECDAPGCVVDAAYDRMSGGTLQVRVTNRGEADARPGSVTLRAALDEAAAGGWAWAHGRYMQKDAYVRSFGEAPLDDYELDGVVETETRRTYSSREQFALTLPVRGTPVLFAGSLDMRRFFLDIAIETDPDETRVAGIVLRFDIDGAVVAPGERLDLQPVLIAEGRDAHALMEAYADRVASEMGARVPERVPSGWCSWYFYYDRVSEADVLANLAALRSSGASIDYVQVDDGFQSRTGDWLTPNERFPSGMASLAASIKDAGYRPGLWLAPFVLHEESRALAEHPGMALRTAGGETLFVDTWLGRCAVLDCTNPEAETWLRDVVGTVVREWGYEVLKLDALAFAAQPATDVRYHAPGTTAAANLRRGLEIIREAAGDEAFLLGCTSHFGPAIGLVDAMRVGPDVNARWSDGTRPSVRHALRMTLQRNWMHGRWWANDPDCLVVRESNTELSEAETRFLATGIALSGGLVVSSDDFAAVGEARGAMGRALLPPSGVAAKPVDSGRGPVPSVWRAKLDETRTLLGVLNWSDARAWAVRDELLAPGEAAFDVWNARMAGMGDVLLEPHEGLLWQVSAPGRGPRVVGDSASVSFAGLVERPVSGALHVTNSFTRPRVLAIESRGQVFEVELGPGERRVFQ